MATPPQTSGPLSGFRVLDLADEKGLPCTRFLADLGADVIKVERPGGDATRSRPPFAQDIPHPERSLYFLHWNANKRGITLDLDSPDGQALFLQLARTADVVVETFRPGTLEDWGLGYEALAAINPRIILTSITVFGQTGPFRDYNGDELIAFALGGVMALAGEPGGPPSIRASWPREWPRCMPRSPRWPRCSNESRVGAASTSTSRSPRPLRMSAAMVSPFSPTTTSRQSG